MRFIFILLSAISFSLMGNHPVQAYQETGEKHVVAANYGWQYWQKVVVEKGDISSSRLCADFAQTAPARMIGLSAKVCTQMAVELSGLTWKEHTKLPVGYKIWAPYVPKGMKILWTEQHVFINDLEGMRSVLGIDVTAIQEELAVAEAEMLRLQAENSALISQISELTNLLGKMQLGIHDQTIAGIQQRLESLETWQEALFTDVGDLKNWKGSLQVMVDKLNGQILVLQEKDTDMTTVMIEVRASLQSLEDDIAVYRAAQAALVARVTEVESKNTELSTNVGTLEREVNDLRVDVDALQIAEPPDIGAQVAAAIQPVAENVEELRQDVEALQNVEAPVPTSAPSQVHVEVAIPGLTENTAFLSDLVTVLREQAETDGEKSVAADVGPGSKVEPEAETTVIPPPGELLLVGTSFINWDKITNWFKQAKDQWWFWPVLIGLVAVILFLIWRAMRRRRNRVSVVEEKTSDLSSLNTGDSSTWTFLAEDDRRARVTFTRLSTEAAAKILKTDRPVYEVTGFSSWWGAPAVKYWKLEEEIETSLRDFKLRIAQAGRRGYLVLA